jgi:hypothetical protein
MAEAEETSPVKPAAEGVRDAAKYLVAAFGAIGAVLVGGLSLTALPSGAHPLIAALAVGAAVLALAVLIGLAVSVITPEAVTLGELAKSKKSSIVNQLKKDEALFVGQGTDLVAFHRKYVQALNERTARQVEYLEDPDDDVRKAATEAAAALASLLDEAAGHILEAANLYGTLGRFSAGRRLAMTALAMVVVAGAGVFAWASAKPAESPTTQTYSRESIWLEHLIATSGYRIERLEEELEHASNRAARRRVVRTIALQNSVRRQVQSAIREMAGEAASHP